MCFSSVPGDVREPRPLVAVVDDEDVIRKALKRLLRSAGLAVQGYASGQAFLESLPGGWPDCVVLDVRMQGLTGFDVQARANLALVQLATGSERGLIMPLRTSLGEGEENASDRDV